jgi:F-type H+-transporting ATPase subunit delta
LFDGRLQPVTVKTLLFMDTRRRLPLLPEVLEAFDRLYDEHRGLQHLDVVTARPLSDDQKATLERRFSDRLGVTVKAVHRVNPDLLAGFRVQAGDTIYDASIDTQLRAVHRRLLTAR